MNRVFHIATAVASCALWAACAAEAPDFEEEADDSIGARQAGLEVQTNTCAAPNPEFLCGGRVWVTEGLRSVALPFCAADDLEPLDALGNPKAPLPHTRLLIAQHGRGSDGGYYEDLFGDVTALAEDAHLVRGDTFVVAPQFLQPTYICSKGVPNEQLDDILIWSEGGVAHDWAVGGLSSKPGEPIERSSYEMIERLLDKALARMPNVREVIFAGQSAGGQMVQRFSLLNDYEFPEGVRVRWFVMEGATQSHAVVLQGGYDAIPEWNGATLTSLDVGVIDMRARYPAMAVTASTPGGALVEAVTFHVQKDGDLQAGDFSRPNLGLAEARSVAFGDVDGLGGDEIGLGIGNTSQVGYGLRVLPAP